MNAIFFINCTFSAFQPVYGDAFDELFLEENKEDHRQYGHKHARSHSEIFLVLGHVLHCHVLVDLKGERFLALLIHVQERAVEIAPVGVEYADHDEDFHCCSRNRGSARYCLPSGRFPLR